MDTNNIFQEVASRHEITVVENDSAEPIPESQTVAKFSIRWIVSEQEKLDVESNAIEFDTVALSQHQALFPVQVAEDENKRSDLAEKIALEIIAMADRPISVGWHIPGFQHLIRYISADDWDKVKKTAIICFKDAASKRRQSSLQLIPDAVA